MSDAVERLRSIKTFPGLIKYLRDDLDWPIESEDVEDLTFEYEPEELGLDAKHAVKIKEIKQLRPLDSKQPWGIFWVNFEKKRLPMVVLRRILGNLVVKKRKSANKTDRPNWQLNDLLFISSYGEEEHRTISFAHFAEDPETDELPVLRVLGWDDQNSIMHLDRVANRLHTQFRWPDDSGALDAWRKRWSEAFTDRYQEAIRSAAELIPRLAQLARTIRKRVKDTLDAESEHGPMRRLLAAVRGLLIHDMDENAFADMYAQTVAYGLLSARFSRPAGLTAQNLVQLTSVWNPFLENLLENLFRLNRGKFHFDVDEVGINDVLDLLRKTNIEAIKAAFNDQNPAEDPVIRFYEGFLKEYDPKQRIRRGIFFTPRPVVSYIVRSVHELLQAEFGLEEGLASTVTWGEMIKKFPNMKLPENVRPGDPFVCILDPATGTGTFLFTCVEVIERTMKDKWCREPGKKSWNDPEILARWRDYVPRHLLPRLYGYELMMAPYAIAHLKLALKLGETGYQFREGDRLHIYLTNSLEPPSELADRKLADLFSTLAKEAQEVNEIKGHKRFTVVIGNPPYNNRSENKTPWIMQLIEAYKLTVRTAETQIQALSDDYIKFLRLSDWTVCRSEVGLFGMITNNGYFDGHIFQDLRSHLTAEYSSLRLINLHGDSRKKEMSPDGSPDKNVFDIMQGVGIAVAARAPLLGNCQIRYADVWGEREKKYQMLTSGVPAKAFQEIPVAAASKMLRPMEVTADDWHRYPLLAECFGTGNWSVDKTVSYGSGFKSQQDEFAIAFSESEITENIQALLAPGMTEAQLRQRFSLCNTNQWNFHRAREALKKRNWEKEIQAVLFRPFDFRHTILSGEVVSNPRREIMSQLEKPNLAILATRKSTEPFAVFVTMIPCGHKIVGNYDMTTVFPLYRYRSDDHSELGLKEAARMINFSSAFVKRVEEVLQVAIIAADKAATENEATVEDILHYAYAVFHSPHYRRRYEEFLKIDFPRLPLTSSLELFRNLAKLGGELVALHLMESPKLDRHITEFIGKGEAEGAKGYPKYKDRTVWINEAQGFKGLPEEVWNFHIGGYQVCEKWLKDRRGRKLSKEDITHYHRIVVALNETIRLMSAIDKVIEKHGGWPGAFVSAIEKTAQKEADLPMAAESSASYGQGGPGNEKG